MFRAVPVGGSFFFRLKSPYNAIVGFGFFRHHSILPAWLAWDSFGGANGAETFGQMIARIEKYRSHQEKNPKGQYQIGCLMIADPIFFDKADWVTQPRDWSREIVRGKTYDLRSGEGRRIWEECLQRVSGKIPDNIFLKDGSPRYAEPVLVQPRLGQGSFRIAVTDAYDRACAVTTEHALPVLEAAHIKPYSQGGTHFVSNGLLLRRDIHTLFDLGYVTVTPDYRFEASRRLKEEFDNGKTYYRLQGTRIHLPRLKRDHPEGEFLAWHNNEVFRG